MRLESENAVSKFLRRSVDGTSFRDIIHEETLNKSKFLKGQKPAN